MKLIGQRWRYEIGNSIIFVDNAFSWTLWTQERLVVNDEEVQASSGWARMSQTYKEPWLTMLGEDELSIRMTSATMSIICAARLGGKPLEPVEMYTARWRGGRKSWPAEAEWAPQEPGRNWARFE